MHFIRTALALNKSRFSPRKARGGGAVKEAHEHILLDRTQLSAQVNKESQELEIARSELGQLALARSALESS